MRKYIFLFFLLFCSRITAQNEIRYNELKDIAYNNESTDTYAKERCKIDIYYPENRNNCPVVVWFHGGGLTGGEKFIPAALKESGLVVMAVNYRLMPRCELQDCIDDAAHAVAWAFHEANKYNGDKQKLFVAGHSAGGYLTSMIGLDKKWLLKYGLDPDSIAGLFPYSGQCITHFAYRKSKGISELQPCIDEYAPLFHIRPTAPPYVMITGDSEQELFGRYEENLYMWRMMKLVGHTQTYIYKLDGYNHGDMERPAHHILKKHIKDILLHRLHTLGISDTGTE